MRLAIILLFFFSSSTAKSEASGDIYNDINCLAQNIYFESRNQSKLGKYGVAEVVLNRVKSSKYPSTICSVVYEAKTYVSPTGRVVPKLHKCQFSWYCDGLSDIPKDIDRWVEALQLSAYVLQNPLQVNLTEGSLFYHSVSVEPYWSKSLIRVVRIDDHIFYKEKDWK